MRLSLVALLLVGCTSNVVLENRPCPCSTGWQCCPASLVCVPDGDRCPSPQPTPTPAPLSITPAAAALSLGGELTFTSSLPVAWSIDEGAVAGAIDQEGHFIAGATPGLYHVSAAAVANGWLTARATVTVGPSRLTTWLGTPGGMGTADGAGSDARFNRPLAVTGDGAGSLYVLDGETSTLYASIRKVTIATGEVQTIFRHIPGAFSADRPAFRCALAWGYNNRLFLVDEQRTSIRMLDPVAQTVTTLVGDPTLYGQVDGHAGDARFCNIQGMAMSWDSHLFVTEGLESSRGCQPRIRDVLIATQMVTTVAGYAPSNPPPPSPSPFVWDGAGMTGAAMGFAGAIASEQLSSNLADDSFYFLDAHIDFSDGKYHEYLREFTRSTGYVRTVGEAPFGQSVCGTSYTFGGGYLSYGNPASAITVFPGDPTELADVFCNPLPYMVSASTPEVRYADDAEKVHTLAGASRQPDGWSGTVAADGAGRVFVGALNDVMRVSPAGEATPVLHIGSALGLATDGAGHLYASMVDGIYVVPTDGNARLEPGDALFARPGGDLRGLAADAKHVYAADNYGNLVRIIDVAAPTQSTAVPVQAPLAVALDGRGGFYVASATELQHYDASTGQLAVVGADAGFVGITALQSTPNGRVLYVADGADHRVRVVDTQTGAALPLLGQSARQGVLTGALPASLNTPNGLALLPTGELLISDFEENAILRAAQ